VFRVEKSRGMLQGIGVDLLMILLVGILLLVSMILRLEDLQRTVQGALASREGEHGSVGVGQGRIER
jgi:hypothetical protein